MGNFHGFRRTLFFRRVKPCAESASQPIAVVAAVGSAERILAKQCGSALKNAWRLSATCPIQLAHAKRRPPSKPRRNTAKPWNGAGYHLEIQNRERLACFERPGNTKEHRSERKSRRERLRGPHSTRHPADRPPPGSPAQAESVVQLPRPGVEDQIQEGGYQRLSKATRRRMQRRE